MIRQRKPLERKTPLVAKTSLERATRLVRSSGPTKAKRPIVTPQERRARDLVYFRSGGVCEIRLEACRWFATEWSHRIARGRGGAWTASDGLHACFWCHYLITDTNGRRDEYERLGYIVRTGADTTQAPVLIAGRWLLLDDAGGSHPIDYQEEAS